MPEKIPGVRGLAPIRIKLKDCCIKKAEAPSGLLLSKTIQFWKKELPRGHVNEGIGCIEERFS